MTVLNKKLHRDIVRSKGMLLAVAAIMAVGTGSFVGMLSTYLNLNQGKNNYYAQSRMADFWVDLKKAPVSEVERLSGMPGVSELRTRITFPINVDLENVDRPIRGLAISMPPEPDPVLCNIVLKEGSYFTENRRNEVIISDQFAVARKISPGDTVALILDGQMKTVYVTGIAIGAEFIYLAAPGSIVDEPGTYGVFYLKRDYMEDVFGFHGACNNVLGILTPEARKVGAHGVLNELERALDDYGVFATIPRHEQFSNATLTSELGGVKTMATYLPLMFLGVAALVLNVLMTRLAAQQRTIVGTLKALGYGNKEIFWHFTQFGLVVGVGGGLGGCLLGHWISGAMVGMYQQVFEFPELINTVYPGVMLFAAIIAVLFAFFGTMRGVKLITALSPAEAMRAPAPATGGSVILERWTGFWSAIDFRWQMILRTQLRNKVRTAISIFAAAMGASIVVVAFGLVDSMNSMIDFQFTKVMKNDYTVSYKDEVDEDAMQQLQRIPGVTYAEPVLNVACTFTRLNHSKKGLITGLKPHTILTVPRNEAGQAIAVPPSGLLMTKRMADQLELTEGDEVVFTPIRGVRTPKKVKVVKIIRSMLGLSVYADYDYLNRLMRESGAISDIQLKTAFTSEERNAFYDTMKNTPKMQAVSDIRQQQAALEQQFNQSMKGTATVMIGFAAIIFFGSILNGSLIAVAERRREIATFRVLGYSLNEVSTIFLRENMLLNVLGTLLGMPLGYGLLVGMMSQFKSDAFTFPAHVGNHTWGYTLMLGILFVVGAQWVVNRSILKLNWAEALSMKE